MKKHAVWLLALATAICVLATATVLSAAPFAGSAAAPAAGYERTPAEPADAHLSTIPAYVDTDFQTSSGIGASPDGSFVSPQIQAGAVRAGSGLDWTSNRWAPGVYMARDWRAISKDEFPMLTGGHDTFFWDELEPSEGQYDYQRIDTMINRNAATGKKTAIGVSTYSGRIEGGINMPSWLINSYPQTVIDCGSGWKIPRYWNSTYQAKYRSLIQALANRYAGDERVSWVQIGIGLYGEIQPNDDRDDQCTKNAIIADGGPSETNAMSTFWINTVNQITDIFMQTFNTGKPVFQIYTPSFVKADERCWTTMYGASRWGMGLFAGGVYANQDNIFANWPSTTYPDGCKMWDPIRYWQNSPTRTIPIAFESYRYMLPTLDTFYWGMLNALNKHPDYLNLESDLFFANSDPAQKITENFPMLYFADQYLGKYITDTPKVWVAMREHDEATNNHGTFNRFIWPQFGNYDFWLYQDDNAPGGRTMTATTVYQYQNVDVSPPVTKIDPYYDPILVGKGPQGWITRRTNHATGNDYVYLNIDDQFVSLRNVQSAATIDVTWFDVITGTGTTWALQYKDAGGATQTREVQRTNTRQWVTTSFDITGADFNNGFNGNDFRLYNGGVADLYVHFVSVGPLGGSPSPTPTATQTPGGATETPTATPTPTATATPTQTPGGPTPTPTPTMVAGETVLAVYQTGNSPNSAYEAPDTFISNMGDANSNFCGGSVLYIRSVNELPDYRAALLKFPLEGIPPGAVVISATLSFYPEFSTNSNPLTVGAYRMLRDWDPCSATWNFAAAGVPWGVAGANDTLSDRAAIGDDYVTLSTVQTWYSLNVTNMVRTWLNDPSQNKGVALKTAPGNVQYNLRSGDYVSVPATRPKLTIVYAVPATATPTSTGTPTFTSTPTTPTATPTVTATATPTVTLSPTITPGGPTLTPTSTPTSTPTATPSSTPINTPTITPTPTLSYDVRANVAGPTYVDSHGYTWLADKPYSTGSWGYVGGIAYTDKFSFPIVDTPDPTLYKTSRYWEGTSQRYQLVGSYRFDVPVPGLYQVYLHFAETAKFSRGTRLRLNLEGATVLDNFDIYLQAPYPYHHAALVQTLPVQVNDGALNIDFYNIIDSPTINAIRVVSLMPATATPTLSPSVTSTPTTTRTPTTTSTPTGPTPTSSATATQTPIPGCPDAYEPDGAVALSRPIVVGAGPQQRNFHAPFDVDWAFFAGAAGSTYTIWTSQLAGNTDTVIELYDPFGAWIARNDNDPALGPRASRLVYRVPVDGIYYIRVADAVPDHTFGCSTGYAIQVDPGAPAPTPTMTVVRSPTATPSASPTHTGIVTNTPVSTPTASATPTRSLTATVTRTASATPTSSVTPSPTITPTPTATLVGESIACNVTVNGDTRAQPNLFVVYSCGGGNQTGSERVYHLILPDVATIRARIVSYQPLGVGAPHVFLLSSFSSSACVPGGWADGSSPLNWATYSDAPAGAAYLIVDGWQAWGNQYTLQVECSGPGAATPTSTPSRLYLPIILTM